MPDAVTVRDLCNLLDQAVTTLFPDEVWVKGAISGLNRSPTGHVYFDLVDPDDTARTAVLPVALFANDKFRVNAILKKSGGGVKMTDGIEIQIRGRLTYYPRQSRMQLIMSLIDPAFTLGRLTAERDRVLAALRADGVLDANQRLDTPILPLRIALVTSTGSAAEADFCHELETSRHPFEVETIDTRVQGEGAALSIEAALGKANEAGVDAIALVRGGGARTDLAAFDDERVARAITASHRPVIVGVGHETDRSVADDVAHVAAKTPTACARWFIDRVDDFAARVDTAARGVARTSERLLADADAELAEARSHLGRVAIRTVERETLGLELAGDRIARGSTAMLDRLGQRLDALATRISDLDPATTMARGWSITRGPDGKAVRSVDELRPGSVLTTALADGQVRSTVDDVRTTGNSES